MKDLIKKSGPFNLKIKKSNSIYASLLEAIVYQQLHGKAAATIYGRLKDLFKAGEFPDAKRILAMPDEKLRSAGLSRSKLNAIRDLSQFHLDGKIPDIKAANKLSNEELVEILTQVKGIGPWTVEMLLIFKLGRMDVMPSSDYGVRNGFFLAYKKKKLPEPQFLKTFSEVWAPYRSMAAWYLWRAADLSKAVKKKRT